MPVEMSPVSIGYDEAVEVAQQFLGDLGLIASPGPDQGLATEDLFVLRFTNGAQTLDKDTVVVVDRATGHARFWSWNPDASDPWPDAVPIGDRRPDGD
jgi:hypothetical protein